ncbi:alpha-L-fucosidase [Spirochaetia bacterium]|nr:alpha-L-fucosidase [Spirochaetia bacterium]
MKSREEWMTETLVPKTKVSWFNEARFGMFIHWGIYAIPAQGEWYRSRQKISVEDYEQYFTEFNPASWDPRTWARAAKNAGMRYMVLTAKHHDGFCLFDSKLTDYKSTKTPAGRDFVREYVEAVRAEGLKVGLYYSLLDWHHPDYPKYNDLFHPMRGNEAFKDEKIDFNRYLDYMHGQVEELVSGYGKIDVLWFDFSYTDGGVHPTMSGKTWRAEELVSMVRRYQPDVLMDNRLEALGSPNGLQGTNPGTSAGDFTSPEHSLPEHGVTNHAGQPIPWELCTTMNNCWGYKSSDHNFKPAPLLIHKLVECVSKGGNLLLNVGPDAEGRFPIESTNVLEQIGGWMERNSESIYGCGIADLPRPDWGRYTRKGNIVYAHLFEEPIGPIPLTGIGRARVKSIRLLRDGSEVRDANLSLAARANMDVHYVTLGGVDPNDTIPLPDPWDTVLRIELTD